MSMNLNKHLEFFNPHDFKDEIHLIGVGAIGSNVLEQLVRLGFTNINIYDFDTVNSHNITNQVYTTEDLHKEKVIAISEYMVKINPKVNITTHPKGWNLNTKLNGVVISAVDSIETRKQLFESLKDNFQVKVGMDFRMGLEEAQAYFANWTKEKEIDQLISTMQFKSDEVTSVVSACGTTLSVLPTIQMIVSIGVMNLINFLKTGNYHKMAIVDSLQGIAKSY